MRGPRGTLEFMASGVMPAVGICTTRVSNEVEGVRAQSRRCKRRPKSAAVPVEK